MERLGISLATIKRYARTMTRTRPCQAQSYPWASACPSVRWYFYLPLLLIFHPLKRPFPRSELSFGKREPKHPRPFKKLLDTPCLPSPLRMPTAGLGIVATCLLPRKLRETELNLSALRYRLNSYEARGEWIGGLLSNKREIRAKEARHRASVIE
jgi:hypothetical protein